MSEQKHTAGPWEAVTSDDGAWMVEDQRGAVIRSRNQWSSKAEASLANARLIAAAPEMLEALKAAFETLVSFDGYCLDPITGSDNPHEHAAGLVKDAISKTEGSCLKVQP